MMIFSVALSLAVLLILGVPVAFALGLAALVGIIYQGGLAASLAMSDIIWGTTSEFVLVAIPLFVLMSEIVNVSGVGRDLFESVDKWLGRLPGGIAISAIVAGAIFGAVSGTAVGVAAVIGSVAIPEMLKRHYSPEMATGTVAASSGLGMIIPPSLPLIMYGVVTETSIAELFTRAIVPGLVITVLFATYVCIVQGLSGRRSPTIRLAAELGWIRSLLQAGPVIALIVVVIGSIYHGIATPTEAAAIGVGGALIIALGRRGLTRKSLTTALVKATRTSCMLLAILASAMLFSYALSNAQLPQQLARVVVEAELGAWTFFLLVMLMLFVLGTLLDAISLVIIAVPIVFPAILAYGFDPVWFGVVVMVNMCFAVITPPIGLCLYVVRDCVEGIRISQVVRGALPFIALYVVSIVILCIFPELVTGR